MKSRIEKLKETNTKIDYSTSMDAIKLFFDPLILLSLSLAFIASFFWIRALSTLDISRAYPITMLSPVFIFIYAGFFLNEKISMLNIAGLVIMIAGLVLILKVN